MKRIELTIPDDRSREMNAQAVATRVDQLPLAPASSESAAILSVIERMATNPDIDPERVERFIALKRQMDADAARKAFYNALSDAKAEIPVINKNRGVGYEHKSGEGKTSYRHEDLGEIARTVDPILARHGLSYRFRTTSVMNEPVSVTCIIAHRDGHSEENTLSAGRDDSGKKNSIQSIGSTITYLQRYTLKAALGLAASADDDGSHADDGEIISEEQMQNLLGLISDVGADIAKFCQYLKVPAIADLPAAQYQRAVAALEAKRAK
jgi:hypothetical protein